MIRAHQFAFELESCRRCVVPNTYARFINTTRCLESLFAKMSLRARVRGSECSSRFGESGQSATMPVCMRFSFLEPGAVNSGLANEIPASNSAGVGFESRGPKSDRNPRRWHRV